MANLFARIRRKQFPSSIGRLRAIHKLLRWLSAIPTPLIHIFAFFSKEINEIRHQPWLILSLVLGPSLILLLFGVGYRGDRPVLQTALVVPAQGIDEVDLERITDLINLNFELIEVSTNYDAAIEKLHAGELDVVQVLPNDIEARMLAGDQPSVEFFSNTINPLKEQWIQYLAYLYFVR
jgi:ABC-2 type transport system permease protein